MLKKILYLFAFTAAFSAGAAAVLFVDQLRQENKQAVVANLPPPEPSSPEPSPQAAVIEKITQVEEISSFARAVEATAPAVVNIFTSRVVQRENEFSPFFNNPFFEDFFNRIPQIPQERVQRSLGSGVIIESDGLIVTNNHVIADADDILVALRDGRESSATVIGRDPETDIAVLKIDLAGLPTVPFGFIDDIMVGDLVLAIGNPYGVGQTVTQGIISAVGRSGVGITTFENFIQTDAAINPGNSGGALINTKGELWGINTAIFSRSGGSQGIGFAIPVDLMQEIVEDIRTGGTVQRGWMGVQLRANLPGSDTKGVFISGVFRNSPADEAGLQSGDEILSLDGQDFTDLNMLINYVASKSPGEIISISLSRNKGILDLTLVLGSRPTSN